MLLLLLLHPLLLLLLLPSNFSFNGKKGRILRDAAFFVF